MRLPGFDRISHIFRTIVLDGQKRLLNVQRSLIEGAVGITRAIIIMKMKMSDMRSQYFDPVKNRIFLDRHCMSMPYIKTDPDPGISDLVSHLFYHVWLVIQHVFNRKDEKEKSFAWNIQTLRVYGLNRYFELAPWSFTQVLSDYLMIEQNGRLYKIPAPIFFQGDEPMFEDKYVFAVL